MPEIKTLNEAKELAPKNHLGEPMEYAISPGRLSLLKRAIDKDHLELLWKDSDLSQREVAAKLEIEMHDLNALSEYWCLPARQRAHKGKNGHDLDALADRLWDKIEPRVRSLIEEFFK